MSTKLKHTASPAREAWEKEAQRDAAYAYIERMRLDRPIAERLAEHRTVTRTAGVLRRR